MRHFVQNRGASTGKSAQGLHQDLPFPLMLLWISPYYVSLLCCCPVENTWTQGTNAIVCPWLWSKCGLLSLTVTRCCFLFEFWSIWSLLKSMIIHFWNTIFLWDQQAHAAVELTQGRRAEVTEWWGKKIKVAAPLIAMEKSDLPARVQPGKTQPHFLSASPVEI